MRVLALDSAFGGISAAVAEGQTVLASLYGDPAVKAAEGLPGLVARTLADAGVELGALDRIAVTLGPGGFTSLRAGIAFAKGLALGAGKPLMGFTTLEALAASAPKGEDAIAAVIDAKRDDVFLQVFSGRVEPLGPAMVTAVSRLGEAVAWPPRLRVCGSGAHLLAGHIGGGVVDLNFVTPDSAALARHCQRFQPQERPSDAVYLRPADARPMA
jgi:tRNA threonylcarbamoyladenosine biosynthesis protein TsaB